MLAIGNRAESPDCLVEKAVNLAIKNAFREAENLLIERFRNTTLSNLQNNIQYSHKNTIK